MDVGASKGQIGNLKITKQMRQAFDNSSKPN